jgi:hypothetical protein
VIVATFAYFALGALWFAPPSPIGRAWITASGYTSPTSGFSASNAFYVFPAVTSLVTVIAVALLARATGTDTVAEAVVLGLVLGIGVAGAIVINTAAFEFDKPSRWTWGVIGAAYHVVGVTVAAVINVLMP